MSGCLIWLNSIVLFFCCLANNTKNDYYYTAFLPSDIVPIGIKSGDNGNMGLNLYAVPRLCCQLYDKPEQNHRLWFNMYQNIKCHFLLPQVDNRNRVVFLVIFKVCVIKRLTAKRWMARKISELKLDYLDPSHFMNWCSCLHIPNSFSQLLTDADIWKTVIICLFNEQNLPTVGL